MSQRICILCLFCLLSIQLLAQRGKDGAKTITALNTKVNDYTALTADALVGSTSITVASSVLSTNFSGALKSGDLIMIIQIQGATIATDPNNIKDTTWGRVTNYGNCGNYELAEVAAVPNATTIQLQCALTKNYTAAGRAQVVRVPRYASLTVNTGASIAGTAWTQSYVGGVIAVEVQGTTTINGAINATGIGFRGGALDNNTESNYGIGEVVSNDPNSGTDYGAEKGEGIAGYQADYDLYGGRYCRGAAANGGGGGNAQNCGGGGGGNAGTISWNGKGNPDISQANYITAWNLEAANFSNNVSSGGGRGGYAFSGNNANPLTKGPNDYTAWGGDGRNSNGGFGGRILDYSSGKIFLGGGGGAGEANNGAGSAGAAGGGIIYLISYGNISGSGQVISDGAAASDAQGGGSSTNKGIDGAGGGGAGGTLLIHSAGTISGISASANGGKGGNQIRSGTSYESNGTGGGGGGGYISLSNTGITASVIGGANGTTNASPMKNFPPNGATKGGSGTVVTTSLPKIIVKDTSICFASSLYLIANVSGTLPQGTIINWYDASSGGTLLGTGTSYVTPVISSSTTYYVGTCPGTYRQPLVVSFSNSSTLSVNSPTICAGSTATLSASGATSYTWSPGGSTGSTLITPVLSTNTTYTLTASSGAGCSGSTTALITVNANPNFVITADTICRGQSTTLSCSGANSYTWSPGGNTGSTFSTGPLTASTNYTVTATWTGSCTATATTAVIVKPTPSLSVNSISICSGQTAILSCSGATEYLWSSGESTSIISKIETTTTSYTVTGTTNNCSAQAVATISISTPSATIKGSLSICEGNTISLTASSGTAYLWSNGTTSQVLTDSLYTTDPATYTVTIGAGSCTASASYAVDIQTIPTLTPSSTVTSICKGGNASIGISGANTYLWSTQETKAIINVTPSITTQYTVTGTIDGCSDSATLEVYVSDLPIVTINSPSICSGESTSLMVTGASSYYWSPSGQTDSVIIITPVTSQFYYVVAVNANGCTNSAKTMVTVFPPPQLTTGNTTTCAGQTFTLNAGGNDQYLWQPGNLSGPSISPTLVSNTTYTLTGLTSLGCSQSKTFDVVVHAPPHILTTSDSICLKEEAKITVTGASSYVWQPGNYKGAVYSVSPAVSTIYTVTATDLNGCTNTMLATVMVKPSPHAQFTADPKIVSILDATVYFSNQVEQGVKYIWDFGNSDSSSTANPSYTYVDSGSYKVCLTASTPECDDVSCHTIIVKPDWTIYIPDAFSPNGDGLNDTFTAEGTNLRGFEMWIMDRWGNTVYHTRQITNPWGGSKHNLEGKENILLEDVYLYKIIVFDVFHKEHSYLGTVTLVR